MSSLSILTRKGPVEGKPVPLATGIVSWDAVIAAVSVVVAALSVL